MSAPSGPACRAAAPRRDACARPGRPRTSRHDHRRLGAPGGDRPTGPRLRYRIDRVDDDGEAQCEVADRDLMGNGVAQRSHRAVQERRRGCLDGVHAQVDRVQLAAERTRQRRLAGTRPAREHHQQGIGHLHQPTDHVGPCRWAMSDPRPRRARLSSPQPAARSASASAFGHRRWPVDRARAPQLRTRTRAGDRGSHTLVPGRRSGRRVADSPVGLLQLGPSVGRSAVVGLWGLRVPSGRGEMS